MQEHPEADAIIPLQVKRECDYPLVGRLDEITGFQVQRRL
jgi:hypothetical protein